MMTKICILLAVIVSTFAPTMAFAPRGAARPAMCPLLVRATTQSSCPHLLPSDHAFSNPNKARKSASHLFAQQKTEVNKPPATIGPSVFFLAFSAMLGKLYFVIRDSSLPITIGTSSLLFVSVAVAYDNLIIGLGNNLFPDARTDEEQYNILKVLSYPRFVFHASGVPFLFTTTAEIGKASGIEWLQSDWVQNGIVVAAVVVALISRVEFFQSPGIELKDTSDSPPKALERQLLWFTYKEPDIRYILPSILLAVWSLVVGVSGFRLEGDAHAAGILLIASAVGVLAGNAQESYVARFTGNFTEVIMLWCTFVAASYVM